MAQAKKQAVTTTPVKPLPFDDELDIVPTFALEQHEGGRYITVRHESGDIGVWEVIWEQPHATTRRVMRIRPCDETPKALEGFVFGAR